MSCINKYYRSGCALALALAVIASFVLTAVNVSAVAALDIVTFGDSTTAPRDMGDYWLRTYSDILRDELPYRGITGTVANKGVRGNMTTNALARFQTDVMDLDPDLVVMQFGINDAWTFNLTQPPRVTLSEYEANLRSMVGTLRGLETKVVLMTPNSLYPIDKNPVMDDYCDVVRQIAGDYATDAGFTFIDMNQIFIDYHAQPNQQMFDLMLPDGVHPSNRGHRFISEHLAAAIGAGPVNFSPGRIPANLAVWLKADASSGGSVASWADQSPGVAGVNNAVQTVVDKRPTLIENASPAGDRPVLHFDGDDYLDIAANTAFESEAVSFFAVYKAPGASTSTQRIFEAEDVSPGNGYWGVSAYATDGPTRQHATYARDASGNYKVMLSDAAACDEFVIVSGVINTSDLTVGDSGPTSLSGNFDRAEMLGGPRSDINATAQGNEGIRIGARASAESNFLNGDIAEILIYDTALGDAERGLVEQYLWQKWFKSVPMSGDANCDGCVDGDDAMILAANWQKTTDALWYEGDFNGDGAVNDIDATMLAANWQSNLGADATAAVPEPTFAVLAAGGLTICFGLGLRRGGRWLFTLVLLAVCGFTPAAAADLSTTSPNSELTFGSGNDSEAAWSPDGRTIAFQSDRDGALFSYQQPDEVRIGRQISGNGGFFGSIYSVSVYRRLLRPEKTHAALLQRFWKEIN